MSKGHELQSRHALSLHRSIAGRERKNELCASYAPSNYGYWGYPAVYNPTYTEEYLEPVIYDEDVEEDLEEDGILDEVEYNEIGVDFYDPFSLGSDLSGYWIDDYTYAWPSWGWCRTFTLDPSTEPYYAGSYVLY